MKDRIVTGAAGAIGHACARRLLAEGHCVAARAIQAIPASRGERLKASEKRPPP